jgi:dTDP-4-dehydrorhamnose 3,5-epimerase
MEIIETKIKDAYIVKPKKFFDDRGYFYETWKYPLFEDLRNVDTRFMQGNSSRSKKNVLRGLHYQKEPWAQGKLVQVNQGRVWDVFVDLRENSLTFGEWDSIELTDDGTQVWIPPGCAHGFVTLSDTADFSYVCTNFYNKESERTLMWNDEFLNIPWPVDKDKLIISDKDQQGHTFEEYGK